MTLTNLQGVVLNTAPLTEDYLPPEFPGRNSQSKQLHSYLNPDVRSEGSLHVWAFGPPGSGKTSVVRKALGMLEERRVQTAYVNCWTAQTFYAILEAILQELRALVGEMRDVSFKFERLSRIAREHRLVIALDEIDQMFLKECNAALYNLARLPRVSLICLSQTRKQYLALDARVQSRLQPRFIGLARIGLSGRSPPLTWDASRNR